ncbi:putative Inner membrane protein YhaI [uncultured Gammaproteobacteria bacterium]
MHSDSTPLFADGHLSHLLFSFKGRVNRRRYFVANILLGAATILGSMLLIGTAVEDGGDSAYLSGIPAIILLLVMSFSGVALMVKRSHDLDKSGHFVWLMLVPLINLWPSLVMLFHRGTQGENRFGPDPLA